MRPCACTSKRLYVEGPNRFASKRNMLGFPIRLSDSEIIKIALGRAAASIREDDDQAAKAGRPRLPHGEETSSRP
jgi:hypothetical protein